LVCQFFLGELRPGSDGWLRSRNCNGVTP